MAIYSASLKNVVTGPKQKFFHIDINYDDGVSASKIFVADIEKDDIMDAAPGTISSNITNVSNMYDWTNKTIVHNLYDITDSFARLDCRGYAFKNKKDLNDNKAASYSDIFAPKSYKTLSINQAGEYMYLLTDKTTTGAWYDIRLTELNSSVYDTYDQLEEEVDEKIYTALYPPVSTLIEANEADPYNFGDTYVPTHMIDGIPYNHILEFPLSINGLFKDNTLLANTLVGKNHLGYDYSQHVYPNEDNSKLNATELRSYRRIGTGGSGSYLVYVNDTSATMDASDEYVLSATSTSVDNESSILGPDDPIDYIEKFERVELLKSVNRYATKTNHKANLYSIELNDTGLNESLGQTLAKNGLGPAQIESAVNTIKKSVINGIRNLCEKIEPGNTQLFNVYFRGE